MSWQMKKNRSRGGKAAAKDKASTDGRGGKSRAVTRTERQRAMTLADEWMSRYIRKRDELPGGVFRCISCGRLLPVEMADNGHYINRACMALRYNEVNCNAQCQRCNRFQEGNMSGYRAGLVTKYGEQRVLMLEASKHNTLKMDTWQLREIAEDYRKRYRELMK